MKSELVKPISLRVERPLYELLTGLSGTVDLPMGKLIRLAVIDYVGRLEMGHVTLPRLGEAGVNQEGVDGVIKKYRAASHSRVASRDLPLPVTMEMAANVLGEVAERLEALEARLDKLEGRGEK